MPSFHRGLCLQAHPEGNAVTTRFLPLGDGGRKARRFLCVASCVLCALLLSVRTARAANPDEASGVDVTRYRPYCGLYCLYAAIRLLGGQAEFERLVNPAYCANGGGSTLAQLKTCAQSLGFEALPVANMTSSFLYSCPYPALLHVKSNAGSKQYDHYVLFLGSRAGKARVFDPPGQIESLSFPVLRSRWDGTGLVVSSSRISALSLFAPAWIRFFEYSVAALLVLWAVSRLQKTWGDSASRSWKQKAMLFPAVQCIALVSAAAVLGVAYHALDKTGFFADPQATAEIIEAHFDSFVPKFSAAQVEGLRQEDALFIDARYPQAFSSGHLDGAINIPVNSTGPKRQESLKNIDSGRLLVVYCQSAQCPYAGEVLRRLHKDGYTNLALLKGGWNAWQEARSR